MASRPPTKGNPTQDQPASIHRYCIRNIRVETVCRGWREGGTGSAGGMAVMYHWMSKMSRERRSTAEKIAGKPSAKRNEPGVEGGSADGFSPPRWIVGGSLLSRFVKRHDTPADIHPTACLRRGNVTFIKLALLHPRRNNFPYGTCGFVPVRGSFRNAEFLDRLSRLTLAPEVSKNTSRCRLTGLALADGNLLSRYRYRDIEQG